MKKVIIACAASALVAGGTTATAAQLISSKDIKNGSIQNRDIKRGTVSLNRLSPGTQRLVRNGAAQTNQASSSQPGAQGQSGSTGAKGDRGDKGDAGTDANLPTAGNWGIVDRNTIGSPDQTLRSGPTGRNSAGALSPPPEGDGSLNLTVQGSDFGPAEKAAWGNEVDFFGNALSGLDQVGYAVFTTGENNARANPNMPAIQFEVDRNGFATTGAPGFTTLSFVPPNSTANVWTSIDADAAAPSGNGTGWFYSDNAATCDQANPCTLAAARAEYPNAQIISAMISKGRDNSWQGAVDAFRINGTIFDFEEHGVEAVPAG